MSTPFRFVETAPISLYAGMGISDTTCTVTPYPVDLDGVKLTMTDFGTTATFTVDPKIAGFEEINSFTGIVDNGNNTATLTGLIRNLLGKYPYTVSSAGGKLHGSSAVVVFSDNPQMYAGLAGKANDETITGQWTFSTFPITPSTPLATNLAAGMTLLSVAAANPAIPIAVGVNDTTTFAPIAAITPTGMISPFAGRVAPTSWLLCDGTAISRATYASLLAVICPSQTVTMTIASPAVVTATAHGLVVGDKIHFTTTGALPTGVSTNTDYYVISAGLTTNAFEFALSPSGTVVNTTGTQSGVHTLYKSAFGKGDGSTTFNVPDLRGKNILGIGASSTFTLPFEAGSVGTNTIAVPDANFPSQGQAITLTGTLPTGLATSTTYFVNRLSSTSISLSTTQTLANAGTPDKTFTSTGMSGVCAIVGTLSARTVLGRAFGEETHGVAIAELANHLHPLNGTIKIGTGGASGGYVAGGASTSDGTVLATAAAGSDSVHNNMSPNMMVNFIIKT